MIQKNRSVKEVNELVPSRVGKFIRDRDFDGAGSARIATYVYEPDHTGELPSEWALGLSKRRSDVWIDVYRWSATHHGYISLRDFVDEEAVSDDDPLGEMIPILEALLSEVSEQGPDSLDSIEVEDILPLED
ncbi:hypothetical protein [Halorhabdus rudnickae]|uniref:hypothetical protein n=1 Tax=Halorhabdus rudnickae TaxID=1775544 RepID=UPI0010839385|nr:hypothetical protein [Halorhabdus rudnickae]